AKAAPANIHIVFLLITPPPLYVFHSSEPASAKIHTKTKQANHTTTHTVEAFNPLIEKSIHLDPHSQPIKRS
ncbi:MAG: hypothetical protein O3B25_16425, partial [Verrucomicrobia bacterium]|nr:hypothetical protein [Verrucomicrobiota bacterium]